MIWPLVVGGLLFVIWAAFVRRHNHAMEQALFLGTSRKTALRAQAWMGRMLLVVIVMGALAVIIGLAAGIFR